MAVICWCLLVFKRNEGGEKIKTHKYCATHIERTHSARDHNHGRHKYLFYGFLFLRIICEEEKSCLRKTVKKPAK